MQAIQVKVTPRASRNEITEAQNGVLKVKLTSAPEKGKANRTLIKLLAKRFGVAQSNVEIIQGLTSKTKLVRIHKP